MNRWRLQKICQMIPLGGKFDCDFCADDSIKLSNPKLSIGDVTRLKARVLGANQLSLSQIPRCIQSHHTHHSTSAHKVLSVKLFVQFGRAYHGTWIICRNAKRVMYHAPRSNPHQEAHKKLKKNRPYTHFKDSHIFRTLVDVTPPIFPVKLR